VASHHIFPIFLSPSAENDPLKENKIPHGAPRFTKIRLSHGSRTACMQDRKLASSTQFMSRRATPHWPAWSQMVPWHAAVLGASPLVLVASCCCLASCDPLRHVAAVLHVLDKSIWERLGCSVHKPGEHLNFVFAYYTAQEGALQLPSGVSYLITPVQSRSLVLSVHEVGVRTIPSDVVCNTDTY